MPDDGKKVFISYRQELSLDFAGRIRDNLKASGYDVFFDIESIPSGKFEPVILRQIEARPHFLAVLAKGTLRRCANPDDWVRREIEHAIRTDRNVVPVLSKGFTFEDEQKAFDRTRFPAFVRQLREYQAITFYDDYFDAGLQKLKDRFLVIPEKTTVKPTPPGDRRSVDLLQKYADAAKVGDNETGWVLPRSLKPLDRAPLPAPTVRHNPNPRNELFSNIWWPEIKGSTGYVVEKSTDRAFANSKEAYRGPLTIYPTPNTLEIDGFYRVKALGGPGGPDSDWSPAVEIRRFPLDYALLGVASAKPLKAPTLTFDGPHGWSSSGLGWTFSLSWTATRGAAGFVLEKSPHPQFTETEKIYEGPAKSFDLKGLELYCPKPEDFIFSFGDWKEAMSRSSSGKEPAVGYYRVMAVAADPRRNSGWSNIVEVRDGKPAPGRSRT